MALSDVLFIPISKTASASIRQALGDPAPNLAGHFTVKVARDVLGEEEFRRRWKFCVIRHPLDRLTSWYHYRNHMESLETWIERRMQRKRDQRTEMLVKGSQREWISDGVGPYGNPFLGAPDGEILVDHMIRFDRLAEEWPLVCERAGAQIDLPHENAAHRRPRWQEFVSGGAEKAVREWWGADWNDPISGKWREEALTLTPSRG